MWNGPGIRVEKSTANKGEKNELHVPSSMNPPQWEIKIWGEDGKEVKNYHDLSPKTEVNQAVITLSFDSQPGKYEENNGNEITYRFVNKNYQSITELEKLETEALTNFLIDQTSGLLEVSKSYQNELSVTLKKTAANQIDLEVTDGSRTTIIKSPNIKFKGQFYLKGIIELWQVRPPQPAKKAWWKTTSGKIIILTTLGIILLLIIIFRKKIWSWIKGSKKKPRETIIL